MGSNYLAYIGSGGYVGSDTITPEAMYKNVAIVTPLLRNAGFSGMPVTYALAHVMHESNNLQSNLSRNYNNLSGIKYIGQHGAKQGPKSPEGDYYAAFDTLQAWANDYARILRLNKGKGSPITAPTANDFLQRLYANGYFTDPNYSPKYNKALRDVNAALVWIRQQPADMITYQGTEGRPDRPVTTITPSTQTVVYSQDPKGRVDAQGKPKGLELFPDKGAIKEALEGLSIWAKIGLVVAGVIVVKKLLD